MNTWKCTKMVNDIQDVIDGRSLWCVAHSDAIDFLNKLPDDSIDLLFTSPPYEKCRTYGIGERMVGGQAWVDWMVAVVSAAAPKVRGLVAVNCEGQTRGYAYSCVPFLLVADLHRAGFNLRKPVAFHRVGIPGSGGPDWLRNDWEPVVCVTRPGRLPWSDPTACGHPPKWAPGGEMSYRRGNGTRVNKWGSTMTGMRCRNVDGELRPMAESSRKAVRARNTPGGEGGEEEYDPPAIANPGNVLKFAVGGNLLGHTLAHENEAPFPLALAEFFVRTFCPPGGVACDPFSGSGTTCHAAVGTGRRFVGCDVRESQVDLVRRRMATVTPPLF